MGAVCVGKSIKTIFVISTVILTGILLLIQTVINVSQTKSGMEGEVRDALRARGMEIANQLDSRILQIAQKTNGLALSVNHLKSYDTDVMFGIADGYVLSDKLVIGSGFWFEPGAFSPDIEYYGPYRSKESDTKVSLDMSYSNKEYGYTDFDWYKNAMKNPGKVAWTGPYLDEVSNTTMLTSAAAIQKNGASVGTVTVDIGITELEDYVKSIVIGETGYAFMVSEDGYYLATKDDEKNMKAKITEEKDQKLADIGKKTTSLETLELLDSDAFGEDSYVLLVPTCINNMKLVLVAPKADYVGPINRSIYISIIMALVVMIVLCAALIVIFNRKINNPINHLMEEAQKIAEGDLSSKVVVNSDDEMGALSKSLNHMQDNLRKVIGSVNNMSSQVAAASQQLTASSDQSSMALHQVADSVVGIAQGAAEQATSAQNIQAAAEQVTERVGKVVDTTQLVASHASEAKEQIVKGRDSIQETVSQMENITASTNSIQESIKKLDDSSNQIADIVNIITGIAEQTNLLALNAAIEAARAGEAGRGFAVVAEEVRKLSEESNSSSQKIAELVKANQADMKIAVEASTSGAESVREGIGTVRAADEVFKSIVVTIDTLVQEITRISKDITQMAEENKGMLQASVAISETSGKNSDEAQSVSAATEEQTASMSEIADASRSLAELAADLQLEMQKFKL